MLSALIFAVFTFVALGFLDKALCALGSWLVRVTHEFQESHPPDQSRSSEDLQRDMIRDRVMREHGRIVRALRLPIPQPEKRE